MIVISLALNLVILLAACVSTTMKNASDYYSGNGSHVFTCFVDFSMAFNNVNYWKLFHKLLDDRVDCNVVAVLAA